MTEITSALIKQIREKTGAGMMDCKKALVETDGNFDEAVDWLRKKGLAAAAKKASRVAADGAIAVLSCQQCEGKSAIVMEMNSETDFVAKNAKFQDFVLKVAKIALERPCDTVEALLGEITGGETIQDQVTNMIATIGENLNLRRMKKISVKDGVVATYIHSLLAPNLGKIGVLVALESDCQDKTKLADFGKKLAMHIAASNPQYLKTEDVPESVLAHERSILLEQIQNQGKSQDVINKMVEGRLRKFFEETVLMEQVYVLDGKKKVKDVLADFSKELGSQVNVQQFVKFVLGEGVEKNLE